MERISASRNLYIILDNVPFNVLSGLGLQVSSVWVSGVWFLGFKGSPVGVHAVTPGNTTTTGLLLRNLN